MWPLDTLWEFTQLPFILEDLVPSYRPVLDDFSGKAGDAHFVSLDDFRKTIVQQVWKALQFLHKEVGAVHLDVKACNVPLAIP